ncbi:MAG: hypothetical protein EBV45_11460, partial [Chloroflexi bacterium]|nr:hypothetical protein [Chloroflexota bacterium]
GTHMDSPWHFLKGLGTMDDLPFDAVIGPCRVVGSYFDSSRSKRERRSEISARNSRRVSVRASASR